MADQRQHQRVKIQNLISHFSFDETGKIVSQGLGNALGIRKRGMILETTIPIKSDLLSLMAVDFEDNLFEIYGKLIYSKKLSAGMYIYGIAFIGSDEQVIKSIAKLIKGYNYRKNHLLSAGIN